jgi:hypothetical protein
VKLTVPVLRDLVMLTIGSGGMVHELFLVAAPSGLRITTSMGLMAGSAVLNGWWFGQRSRESGSTVPQPLPSPSQSSSSGP